jgi:hypothetical protein
MSTVPIATVVAPPAGLNIVNGVTKSTAAELSGRFYLVSGLTGSVGNWIYLGTNWALATDAPPNINTYVSATADPKKIGLVTQSGNILISVPRAGKYNISIFGLASGMSSTTGNGEFRLCTYSSPAWPAANQTAKTYAASSSSVGNFANNPSSWLAVHPLVTGGSEIGGCSFSGILAGGTLVAPLLYNGGSSAITVSTALIQVNCDYFLS